MKNMNQNQTELSSENIPLSFKDLYEQYDNSMLSALYPKMPENYFEDKDLLLIENDKNIIDKFVDLPIKPIIRKIDLNNGQDTIGKENKSKTAWQIGISFDF